MTPLKPAAHPRVILKPRRAKPFLNRHPWVFAGAIGRVSTEPGPGEVVDVYSHDGHFIARGLFNPHSNIRVRLYAWDIDEPLAEDFWTRRVDQASRLREALIDSGMSDSYRVVFSESDGLSGLIVDRYSDWLLVQLNSLALASRRELIIDLLQQRLQPRGIWLRTEPGIAKLENMEPANMLVRGEAPPLPLVMRENGLLFEVDVTQGQKTGGFLDQRDNHLTVARYAHGHEVLDLFCYAGGFGITAAAIGKARSVECVDSSEAALSCARRNAELNGVQDRVTFARADAFRYLEQAREQGRRFDTVICDPPKLARNQNGVKKALQGYRSLNELSASLLREGGLLVTCSCSGLVGRVEFEQMLSETATSLGRPIQILETRAQGFDHPVSPNCPENHYLKCYICRVL